MVIVHSVIISIDNPIKELYSFKSVVFFHYGDATLQGHMTFELLSHQMDYQSVGGGVVQYSLSASPEYVSCNKGVVINKSGGSQC